VCVCGVCRCVCVVCVCGVSVCVCVVCVGVCVWCVCVWCVWVCVCVSTVLRGISVHKAGEVLHKEELHNLYPLLNIIKLIKLRTRR
jgi:hypothetical protein